MLRTGSAEGRFEAMHASELTALVGREEELELLLRRWSRAKAGEGQVVLLSGEAGIGKSRLTAALLERLTEPHTCLRDFCSPRHTDSAFYVLPDHWPDGRPVSGHHDSLCVLPKLILYFSGRPTPAARAAASPLGSLTPAEAPLIEAEKLFRQPAPALSMVRHAKTLQSVRGCVRMASTGLQDLEIDTSLPCLCSGIE